MLARPFGLVSCVVVGCSEGPGGHTGDNPNGDPGQARPADSAASSASPSDPRSRSDEFVAGSRLKVRVIATTDGAKQAIGFHDSKLAVDCAFANATDGKLRCLPDGVRSNSGGYFADARCTVPVVYEGEAACRGELANGYIVSDSVGTCTTRKVSRLKKFTGASVFKIGNNFVCERDGEPHPSVIFALDAEVPPTEFVEGQSRVEP